MIGQVVLGKYTVVRPLAEGGMSRLYLARQTLTGREVVVKVLKEQFLADPATVEHFRREIHVSTHFRHPHAVAALDAATGGPSGPVLVMELLRGEDLQQLLARKGRFSVDRVARYLAQLCDVLQAAHDAGIVHRDLKPGNCMILAHGTPRETLKLMDFGLAQMRSVLYIAPEEVDDPNLPAAAGTPEYICPELIRGQGMDHRGDLYSLGIVLFELLTGKRPFAGETPDDLLVAHLREPPPRFADLGVGELVPPGVEAVVRTCLAKYPDERPGSAAELAQRFLKAVGVAAAYLLRTPTPPAGSGLTPRPAAPPAVDRNAVRHSIETVMLEAMALVKIKGFIHDLGGTVVESVPGLIRVRLPDPQPRPERRGGLLGWGDGAKPVAATQVIGPTDVELHMDRPDPSQPSRLTVTLLMRPAGGGLVTPAWRARCNQIGRDLQAYLMGR